MAMPDCTLTFGHSRKTLMFWRRWVGQALRSAKSPFYLFSTEPMIEALAELRVLERNLPVPVRHWFSCKTQPVGPLLAWWKGQGRGIEVVSEFEFLAAQREGFAAEQILVNGPAKHRWLGAYPVQGLRVNFDSMAEASALLPNARKLDWSVGLRCQSAEEQQLDGPGTLTQFGMAPKEVVPVVKMLKRAHVRLETLHFHLRTNVSTPAAYGRALHEFAEVCRAARFAPRYVDCGGGFPVPNVLMPSGQAYDAEFGWPEMIRVYRRALAQFDGVRELWLENGRFLLARTGVLVTRILDIKDRGKVRHLICDAGRTMNALISTWERHEVFSIPQRSGPSCLTSICGPTCMAFDQLSTGRLCRRLRPGDHVVWMDAGAYHIPWETRFSHGLSAVLWHENGRIRMVRRPERFEEWWGQWLPSAVDD